MCYGISIVGADHNEHMFSPSYSPLVSWSCNDSLSFWLADGHAAFFQ